MEASPAYKAAQLGDAVREPSGRLTPPPLLPQPGRLRCLRLGFSSCPYSAHLGDTWPLSATRPRMASPQGPYGSDFTEKQ